MGEITGGSTAWLTNLFDNAESWARAELERYPWQREYGDVLAVGMSWPAGRVLTTIDADRRLLALHRYGGVAPLGTQEECRECVSPWPCQTLRLMATRWAGRSLFSDGVPDGWRPEED